MVKWLVDNALHKHYGINQKKDCQQNKFRINKVCVASLTKFYNFLKLCELKSFSKKIIKKMKNAKKSRNFFNFVGLNKGGWGKKLYGKLKLRI